MILAVAVFAAVAPGAWGRATPTTRTTADEPHYLLTATSLFEDRSLDVADERAALRYLPYHEVPLPSQARIRADGSQVVPHDPLLPAFLAVPMGLGGWRAAKLAMAAMAAGLAVLMSWFARRRLGVAPALADAGAFVACCSPPLAVYATQVYPEVPAAFAVLGALGAATAAPGRRGSVAATVLLVSALPWLSVKYVAVAAVIAVLALVRAGWSRTARVGAAAAWAVSGAAFVLAHRAWYGGWTAYASGSHFVDGEVTVVGAHPNYAGRSARLFGLLIDRTFGLAPWQPAWILVVPAAAWMARKARGEAALLLAPAATGWLVATFVALTMRGWWFPGRQVVVVLPLMALAVLAWIDRRPSRARRRAFAGLALCGVAAFGVLAGEAMAGTRTWVVDFMDTANPVVQGLRWVLPDLR